MIDARITPYVSRKARHLPVLHQSAALCYRYEKSRPEVLLITTRKARRWIIPKGWLIDGLTPSETARQEAWEEAGVRGVCSQQPTGRFFYQKQRRKKGAVLCAVDVYPLLVHSVASRFPECGQRQRKWFSTKKAALQVNSPELAVLFKKLEPVLH